MAKGLNEWRDEIYAWAQGKGWWDDPSSRSFGDLIALCHSELSEALEAYRENPDPAHTFYFNTAVGNKPEGVPSELADTIIRILDMCGHYKIDIEQIMDEKMAYNHLREHRHGGKVM